MLEILKTLPRGNHAAEALEAKLGIQLTKMSEPSKQDALLTGTVSDVINNNAASATEADLQDARDQSREAA